MSERSLPGSGLIDEVSASVRQRFGPDQGATAEALVRAYYDHVGRHDLDGRSPIELYGAAISHLQLARSRHPGERRVRIYSPTVEDDGWRSPHSVIDVVVDDSPFIVASVLMAVEGCGLDVHHVLHPVLHVRREGDRLVGPAGAGPGVDHHEAFVHLEVGPFIDAAQRRQVERSIDDTLDAVAAAVADWRPMTERADELATALVASSAPPGADGHDRARADRAETAELLGWMIDEGYIFIGARNYALDPADGVIRAVPGTGLGVLRDRAASQRPVGELAPAGVERVLGHDVLLLTKTNARSPIHRPDPMDYVGVRSSDPDTGVITEVRFIGLFTARAYTETVTRLPVIRRKAAELIERAGFAPASHDANRLLAAIEDHPRDELFQASVDELLPTLLAIVRLYERNTVRLFTRHDSFGRSVSCLVYVPRDRFRTEVRESIQQILEQAYGGHTSQFEVSFSSASMARLHVIIATTPGEQHDLADLPALEHRLEWVTRTWGDHLERELIEQLGEAKGTSLSLRWKAAFPAGYREDRIASTAVADIERLEALAGEPDGTLAVHTYHPPEADEATLNVKLYRFGEPVPLSAVLPLLQAHGVSVVDEHPYHLTPADGAGAWIHDFGLTLPRPAAENIRDHGDEIRARLEDSLLAAWNGHADIDGFAQLVLLAGLSWREVAIVRAFARYLRQAGATFTPEYIQEVVTSHAGLTRLLVDRFHCRLDPDRLDPDADVELREWIVDALDAVPRLDEDRILRGLDALVDATLRTNVYQVDSDGTPHDHLVFKLDPSRIPELPRPRPAHEIYVSSPRVEGVHLRAGRVARGGIRWSDRREDFRTEVLALMKAQVVKNSVIVPAGAKGGFVCRQLPDDPAAVSREVEACYRIFIGGLLDVTDNLVGGEVVPPARTVRLDADDPYLVVAADRGTATLSDVANAIAIERGFWLGDAFASGGATGYDHKAMGITARGAWVSVRRHLAEVGVDPARQPFTVVGIGDMSGDVFGNGMLLSDRIRLVGAFDHRHVFVDPDPDPQRTHAERRRLFELPVSTWADFDRTVMSAGGIIVPRSAKAVALDQRLADALGCHPGTYTPTELIRVMLRAPVDLLWNGGIGTYVKAAHESHDDVGDRANDAVRIDADELRCRVVGEGGNLGFTQLGRIEAALGGVRVNTDAVDNSGGVNCSDREVNLKILLDRQVEAGALTARQRNELLSQMTDEVAEQVLADSEAQTLALSSARVQAPGMTHVHARHLAWLEEGGGLDRQLEALPSDEALAERSTKGLGLTQPELAVVMAYTKDMVASHLLDSSLPDDPQMLGLLEHYLPVPLRERFGRAVREHPLRRELVATQLTNRLVNRAGISMTLRLGEETAASVPEVARAHLAAWRILALDDQWARVDAYDGSVPPDVILAMHLSTKALGERATRWLIRNRHSPLDVPATVGELEAPVREVLAALPQVIPSSITDEAQELVHEWSAAGVPNDLALQVALDPLASTALDIVAVARAEGAPLDLAARVYFLVDDRIGLGWLRRQIDELPRNDMWSTLARTALRDDLYHEHASLARRILASGGHDSADERVARWVAANQAAIDRTFDVLVDIRAVGEPGLEHLSVGLREVRNLMRRASGAAL